ncbi:MAG: hypothetical protein LBW85_12540 [Deltaproteobacteria bacterium]|jgi:hypothetical protein|nr:hypothetical protein [Deltaproteobacteria bacterium]
MPHDGFIAGVVTRIVPAPGCGPGGRPPAPPGAPRARKIMVCMDLVTDRVDPDAERFLEDGLAVVEAKSPPPHFVVFRGEWAESLDYGALGVGDLLGARFTWIPWDPVTLAEMARSSPPGEIPVLGAGESPGLFMKAAGPHPGAAAGGRAARDGEAALRGPGEGGRAPAAGAAGGGAPPGRGVALRRENQTSGGAASAGRRF